MFPRHPVLLWVAFLPFLPGQFLFGEPPAPLRPDHYGDPLPGNARFRLGTVRLRHHGYVLALAWLPDGRTLASAGWDRTVRLWQIPGGKQLAKWDDLEGVVFSPDGRSFACGEAGKFPADEAQAIRIVDVATGKEQRRIKSCGTLFNLAPGYSSGFYSPDGKILALREGVRLYAVESGKELGFLQGAGLDFGRPVAFSPDSRTVLVAAGKGTFRWTISTGAKAKIFEELDGFAFSFAFSPDGKMLAAVVSDGHITLRSWPAGKELRRFRINEDPGLIDSNGHDVLAFSPDGKFLASSDGGTIRLWNPATGARLRRFEGQWGDYIHAFAFSPDGSLLASAGSDGSVVVWEVQPRKSPRPLTGVGHWLKLVGLAADHQSLLTRSAEGSLTVWDVRNGCRLRTLPDGEDHVERFRFGPDIARKRALLRQELEHYRQTTFAEERISCSAFSPDNAMLAVGGEEGVLLLRKTAQGIERRLLEDEDRVKRAKAERRNISSRALTFSPDGRTLAACFTDSRLFLWDPRTGRPRHILSFPKHVDCRRLEFSPDGRILALTGWGELYLVELASGKQFRERLLDQRGIDSLVFAPDNRTLALVDIGSLAAIHLWDLPTGKEIHTLEGHHANIDKLVFSPDGTFLLSGSSDNTVLSWDIAALLRRRPSRNELSAAQLTTLWSNLASKDAARAQRAVAELIQAPDSALPFLAKSLPPVPPAKMAPIAALIADLDHEEFFRRDNASQELAKFGELAAPALRKTLTERPSLEMRRRIESLLETIEARPLSPNELRTLRVLQVLETIGSPQAQRILEELARGSAEAPQTHEAKASLQRLERRRAKP